MTHLYWIHLPEHTDILSEGYIGVSNNFKKRLWEHQNNTENPHLQNAFEKYKNITHTILLQGPESFCYEIEKKLRPIDHIGWNINKGGLKPPVRYGKTNHFYGRKHTEETKEKLRQANLGKKHTKETKILIGLASKERIVSQSTRRKLSIMQIGKKHSEDTREKLRIAWIKRKQKFAGNYRFAK